MKLFYVETRMGCTIYRATSLERAEKIAIRESGTDNFKSIREATEEDKSWVLAMGGMIRGD